MGLTPVGVFYLHSPLIDSQKKMVTKFNLMTFAKRTPQYKTVTIDKKTRIYRRVIALALISIHAESKNNIRPKFDHKKVKILRGPFAVI
jgi:hypothetical protein